MNMSGRRHQDLGIVTGQHRLRAIDARANERPSKRIGVANRAYIAPFAARKILLVDPNIDRVREAYDMLSPLAHVELCGDFVAAREQLLGAPPDLLITNLRLQRFNGLHLVHLAPSHTRCVVYSAHDDLVLAREVQAAGAFYERANRLSRVLTGYVQGTLPARDRRNLSIVDRRRFPRGGRRAIDR
jgi:hypothetical protein